MSLSDEEILHNHQHRMNQQGSQRDDLPRLPTDQRGRATPPGDGSDYDSIMKALNKKGIRANAELFHVDEGDVQVLKSPTDQLWKTVINKFYSNVNANTESMQTECLKTLITDLILNTTSDKRDYQKLIYWPTGVSMSIYEAISIPTGYKMRNFMSHPVPQLMASAIMTHIDNKEFVEKVRAKNAYGPNQSAVGMFDFVFAANNPFVRKDQAQMFKARENKVYGTRTDNTTAYKRSNRNSGGESGSGEARENYQEALF